MQLNIISIVSLFRMAATQNMASKNSKKGNQKKENRNKTKCVQKFTL